MIIKKEKCLVCKHPKDDHSVYRNLCLINGCKCTEMGGWELRTRSKLIALGFPGETVSA